MSRICAFLTSTVIFVALYSTTCFSTTERHGWSDEVTGCIRSQNIGDSEEDMTVEKCKNRCLEIEECRGFDIYKALLKPRTCWYKFATKFTADTYKEPCDIAFYGTKHYEMVAGTHEWTAVTGACTTGALVTHTDKNFEECKQLCTKQYPNCRSIEYKQGICNLNEAHRNEELLTPCTPELMEMTEYKAFHGSIYTSVGLNIRGEAAYRISTATAQTMFHCTLACTRDGRCLSFGYNRDTQECDLYRIGGNELVHEDTPGFEIQTAEEFRNI